MTDQVAEQQEISVIKSRARAGMLAEVLFILLPFIVMSIVFSTQGKILSLFSEAEWSFAASVLAGQAVVRLSAIAASRKLSGGSYLSLILAAIIVLILVPSVLVLGLVLAANPVPAGLIVAQLILFSLALVAFFTLGLVGDLIREGAR